MIGISKLLVDTENFGDQLRYSQGSRGQRDGTHAGHGPVVVYSVTRTCNLKCIHCYSDSDAKKYENELSNAEAKAFIDDLADFNVPVLLFSGGEPFARPDILDLAAHANAQGIRTTFSSNGTLMTPELAQELKRIGVGYVGVSLDGIESNNDKFRGKTGAFREALRGIRYLQEAGQRTGLRFTINKHNFADLSDILRLVEEENIPRICFYHLVYSGRGRAMEDQDISLEESREAIRLIIDKALDFHRRGLDKEILTVDNHADAIFLYRWAQEHLPERAEIILDLLKRNGGNRSGIAISNVDNVGNVHADQFTQYYTFGNVRETPFSQIWQEAKDPILAGLKNRRPLLKGRCASCQWLDVCNGNFRARAEAVSGDFWESDPACYLTDEEIGLESAHVVP